MCQQETDNWKSAHLLICSCFIQLVTRVQNVFTLLLHWCQYAEWPWHMRWPCWWGMTLSDELDKWPREDNLWQWLAWRSQFVLLIGTDDHWCLDPAGPIVAGSHDCHVLVTWLRALPWPGCHGYSGHMISWPAFITWFMLNILHLCAATPTIHLLTCIEADKTNGGLENLCEPRKWVTCQKLTSIKKQLSL